MLSPRFVRTWLVAAMLSAAACSGSVSCGGCAGSPLLPIPGGFDPAAQLERAAQIRLSNRGLDFIEAEFKDLLSAYVTMQCGGSTDVPCPTGFVTVPGGAPNPASCDALQQVCVEAATGGPGPLVGFELERTEQSGATICRDDLSDPNRRACYAWLRFEGLQLAPTAPDRVLATITAQIQSNVIPFRYDALGMDCSVTINSAASGTVLQDIVVDARVTEWTAPSRVGGRQLQIVVDAVDAMIPDMDIQIERDPVHGSLDDLITCGLANLGVVKNALIPRLTGSLADIVQDEVAKALGMRCGRPGLEACPSLTSCNAEGFCEEDATGTIVPTRLGLEGRMDFSALLGGLTAGRPGQGDLSFLVGGQSSADTGGLAIGMLGGAEVVTPDPSCALILPSPRLRPGWIAPPALPAAETVDLDFDGTPETPYMVAAGVSEALLDQVLWTVYTTGLFCQSLSAYDIDLLNTGSLSLLVPSLAQLTHSDRHRHAIYPARVTLYPRAEPQITIGSGRIDESGSMPVLAEPLIDILLDDMELSFFAVIEERWVRLMTVTLDINVGLGALVTPSNAVQLVIGDLTMSLSDVRVTNSELLAEDPMELAMALPSLIQLALPQVAGAFPAIALPGGAELGGFELEVLGIRGVESAPGVYPNLGIYADLSFDPSLVPSLLASAETSAEVAAVHVPAPDRFSVRTPGGPELPVVELLVESPAPEPSGSGGPVRAEAQLRLDGGLWTPFFPVDGRVLRVQRPELLVQGRHVIEVRARWAGEYRTLDPTPAVVEVVIDAEPPRLTARILPDGSSILVDAYDVVSGDDLELSLRAGDSWRPLVLDEDGIAAVPELAAREVGLAVAATDRAGRRSELVLREEGAPPAVHSQVAVGLDDGCVCVRAGASAGAPGLGGLIAVGLLAALGLGRVVRPRAHRAPRR